MSLKILNELFNEIKQFDLTQIENITAEILKHNIVLQINKNSLNDIFYIECTNKFTLLISTNICAYEYMKRATMDYNNTNQFFVINSKFDSKLLLEMFINVYENITKNYNDGQLEFAILVNYNINSKSINFDMMKFKNYMNCDYYIYSNRTELNNYLNFTTPKHKKICFQLPI
jgi:hypothetical protein